MIGFITVKPLIKYRWSVAGHRSWAYNCWNKIGVVVNSGCHFNKYKNINTNGYFPWFFIINSFYTRESCKNISPENTFLWQIILTPLTQCKIMSSDKNYFFLKGTACCKTYKLAAISAHFRDLQICLKKKKTLSLRMMLLFFYFGNY